MGRLSVMSGIALFVREVGSEVAARGRGFSAFSRWSFNLSENLFDLWLHGFCYLSELDEIFWISEDIVPARGCCTICKQSLLNFNWF